MEQHLQDIIDHHSNVFEGLNLVSVAEELRIRKVLEQDDCDMINNIDDPAKQRRQFFILVKTKGHDSFQHLIESLKKRNYLRQAEFLENAIPKKVILAHNNNATLEPGLISKLWNVPSRNHYFSGRDLILQKLIACFVPPHLSLIEQSPQNTTSQHIPSQSNYFVITACQGLGGVGKTQLAIEFAHRQQNSYSNIFWILAEDSTHIEIAYQKLAQDLKIYSEQAPNAIVNLIKVWFHQHPDCLLVYDNAPDYESIQDYFPSTGCHVLVTSRNTDRWHWEGKSIVVDVFTVEEARQYIQQLLGDQLERLDGKINWKDVDSLAELLGYLPLALAQAGAYIKDNMTISRYLILYKQHTEKLLADASMPHHKPVFVTWDITMEAIKEKSPLAAQLLEICAYVASEDIPIYSYRRSQIEGKITLIQRS